jgi:hypothetical protein
MYPIWAEDRATTLERGAARLNRRIRVSRPTMERISAIWTPQESPILRFFAYSRGGNSPQGKAVFSGDFSAEQPIRSNMTSAKSPVLAPRTDLKNVCKVLIFNIL